MSLELHATRHVFSQIEFAICGHGNNAAVAVLNPSGETNLSLTAV